MAYLLLGLVQIAGLLLIPLGAPGAWIQLAALALYSWSTRFGMIGTIPLVIFLVVVLTAELTGTLLAGGRGDRATLRTLGFAGLAGGATGVALGFLFPLVGSLVGAFAGVLLGSLLAALRIGPRTEGFGHLGALVIATTMKVSAGVAIATFTLLSLMNGV